MATHDQSELGPVFEQLEVDGYLALIDNSYGVAAEFVRLATEAGVIIHTDQACEICIEEGIAQPRK